MTAPLPLLALSDRAICRILLLRHSKLLLQPKKPGLQLSIWISFPEGPLLADNLSAQDRDRITLITQGPMSREGTIERRLAAILAADIAGYSRLMNQDEVATLNALKAHRRELVDPTIAMHRGRIVKTTGDGMLVEFASIVDAVGCAVSIQRGMIGRNEAVPQDRQIIFRIGINVGDIIAMAAIYSATARTPGAAECAHREARASARR